MGDNFIDDGGDLIAVYKEKIEINKTKINEVLTSKRTELAKKIKVMKSIFDLSLQLKN